MFFFFKQKTEYEMRISDWSSDVCSSDLLPVSASSSGILGVTSAAIGSKRRFRVLTASAANSDAPPFATIRIDDDGHMAVETGHHVRHRLYRRRIAQHPRLHPVHAATVHPPPPPRGDNPREQDNGT